MTERPTFIDPIGRELLDGLGHLRRRRTRNRRVVAAVSAAVVVVGLGTLAVDSTSDRRVRVGEAQPSTSATSAQPSEMRTVVYQEYQVTIDHETRLSCVEPPGGGLHIYGLYTWADTATARFRQDIAYSDGQRRTKIALGDAYHPTEAYESAPARDDLSVRCGDSVLGGDTTDGPEIFLLNPPPQAPELIGYEDAGPPVPGEHRDSRGRPATLYRAVVEGFTTFETYVDLPVTDISEWYVADGLVLQSSFTQETSVYRSSRATTLLSTQETTVPNDFFDTANLEKVDTGRSDANRIEATAIKPSLSLGAGVRETLVAAWPNPVDPGGPVAVARRFAVEVLRWNDATIAAEPADGSALPTYVTIAAPPNRDVKILVAPSNGGWGIIQIGEPRWSLSADTLSSSSIDLQPLAGAVRAVIHAGTTAGKQHAWQVDLNRGPNTVVLQGVGPMSVASLIVLFETADGEVVATSGGTF